MASFWSKKPLLRATGGSLMLSSSVVLTAWELVKVSNSEEAKKPITKDEEKMSSCQTLKCGRSSTAIESHLELRVCN